MRSCTSILPAIALGSIPLAIIVRITRASVLDVVHEDYVRTAEAKGLLERTITRRHVLRNALASGRDRHRTVSRSAALWRDLDRDGVRLRRVGRFVGEAISNRDYAVLQGFILIIATMYVFVNLIVDVSYG